MRISANLLRHIQRLATVHQVKLAEQCDWLVVTGVRLPPGYNFRRTSVLIELPADYPLTPPGVWDHVYVDNRLRFRSKELRDLHAGSNPLWDKAGQWGWWCYERVDWDPRRDDLVRFIEVMRKDFTDPPTRS